MVQFHNTYVGLLKHHGRRTTGIQSSSIHELTSFFSSSSSLSPEYMKSCLCRNRRVEEKSIIAPSRSRVTTYLMHIRVLVTELEEQRKIIVYAAR